MEYKDKKIDASVSCKKLGITNGRIIGLVKGSYTKVIIKDKDRGEGYDQKTQTYKGFRSGGSWARGENKGYNQEHEIHRKRTRAK